MKKILIPFFILTFTCSFYACEEAIDEALDINVNPLVAEEANPNAILPYVFTTYSARKTTELGTRTIDVPHQYSDTFNSPKAGNTSSFLTGNTWNDWYTDLLGNLHLIEQDAKIAGESSNNVQAVAKIMKGHLFFELTCIWEKVPFTEALDGGSFPNPKFDSQETILDGVVTLMDEAIALLDTEVGIFDFSSGDILLGGNETAWRALANSIKIRTLMLLRNVVVRESEAETALIEAFGQPTVSTPVFLRYEGESSSTNGYFDVIKQFLGSSNEDPNNSLPFGPAPALRDQLFNSGDPRLRQWCVDPTGTDTYPAANYDQFPRRGAQAIFSDNTIRADYPDIYFLPSEIALYKAELLLDGVALPGTQTAQQAFEEGVTYAVNFWGGNGGAANTIDGYSGTPVTTSEVTSFVAGLGAVTREKIAIQLWLESFLRPIAAWNTVRRTGMPKLAPPGGATIERILQRFAYPPDEVSANTSTPVSPPNDQIMPVFERNQQ